MRSANSDISCEVVGDEQDGKAEPRCRSRICCQDLALHDDVERRRRLVHDDQLRLERQRNGDARCAGACRRRTDGDSRRAGSPGCRPARTARRPAPAPSPRAAPVWRAITSRNCSRRVITGLRHSSRSGRRCRHRAPPPGGKPRLIEVQGDPRRRWRSASDDFRRRPEQPHQRKGDGALAAAGFAGEPERSRRGRYRGRSGRPRGRRRWPTDSRR